jgi:hypothetical protein
MLRFLDFCSMTVECGLLAWREDYDHPKFAATSQQLSYSRNAASKNKFSQNKVASLVHRRFCIRFLPHFAAAAANVDLLDDLRGEMIN